MKILFSLFFVFVFDLSIGQEVIKRDLIIGDTVPPVFWKIIPNDSDAQLYILDFWATSCSYCLESFPHMKELQDQFNGKLKVVLVNSWETSTQIAERLSKINNSRNRKGVKSILLPDLAGISGDTILSSFFPSAGLPHHVWIKKSGKVVAITAGYNATNEHVSKILNGEEVHMSIKRDLSLYGYNPLNDGFFNTKNDHLSYMCYSGFLKYNPGFGGSYEKFEDSVLNTVRFTVSNTSILDLYRLGFQKPTKAIRIMNEVMDKSMFNRPVNPNSIDRWQEENVFSYEIVIPKEYEAIMNEQMQTDLNSFFGREKGIEGKLEKKKLNAFVLIMNDFKLLKSSGGERIYLTEGNRVQLRNQSFGTVAYVLTELLENMDEGRPFLNEIDIDPNLKIDFELTGDLKDVENVKKQLHKYGLDIIKAEREVEVLVVRDK